MNKTVCKALSSIRDIIDYINAHMNVSCDIESNDFVVITFEEGSTICVQDCNGILHFMGRQDLAIWQVVDLYEDILCEENGLAEAMFDMAR